MSNVYGGMNRTNRSRELDRVQWAAREMFVFTHDPLKGTGFGRTTDIDFKTVFEGQPLFHWAVELQEASVGLITGSYPSVNAGVYLWETTGPEPQEGGVTLYSGATVWMVASINASQGFNTYLYTFRFGFEGVVFKNVSTLKGLV